jgi:predicted secreted protein|tara:strand:- start:854 stop:1240 length:387 start_codon:yes stop_codon:yes gene_type:complete
MATKSFGVTVTVNTIAIGELTDVTPGGVDVNNIDTTAHDSSGGWKTFMGGLSDGGTLELSGNYVIADAGQVELRASRGDTASVVVTFSNASTSTFSAVIGGYNLANPLDDKIEFSCSLKVTGPIVIAA